MTESQIRFIENNLQLTNRMIAERLELTEPQIRNYLTREGITRTWEQRQQIMARIGENHRQENNGNWKNGRSRNNYYYQKRMKEKFPERIRARQKIYYHKKAGNIVPDLCEICGTDKSLEAHHVDYGQPLLVDWLCSVCHRELHRKEQEQGRSVLQTVQSS